MTGELCDKLASKYKMVRTIHQDNGGLSAARNTGIKHSKGEFILFVDGDDFWSNLEFLDNLSKNIDTYKSDVVIFLMISIMEKMRVLELILTLFQSQEILKKTLLTWLGIVC